MSAVGFFVAANYQVKEVSIFSLLRVFINGSWILSNAFLNQLIRSCFFLQTLNVVDNSVEFWTLNRLCIPGVNPAWPWRITLFSCWIQFPNILLSTVESVFMVYMYLYI